MESCIGTQPAIDVENLGHHPAEPSRPAEPVPRATVLTSPDLLEHIAVSVARGATGPLAQQQQALHHWARLREVSRGFRAAAEADRCVRTLPGYAPGSRATSAAVLNACRLRGNWRRGEYVARRGEALAEGEFPTSVAALSPRGDRVASASWRPYEPAAGVLLADYGACVRDLHEEGWHLRTTARGPGVISCIEFSQDGNRLAIASGSQGHRGEVRVVQVDNSWGPTADLWRTSLAALTVRFAGEDQVAFLDRELKLYLWNFISGIRWPIAGRLDPATQVRAFDLHDPAVSKISLAPVEQGIAALRRDQDIIKMTSYSAANTSSAPRDVALHLGGSDASIDAEWTEATIAFSADGRYLATSCYGAERGSLKWSSSVQIWDVHTPRGSLRSLARLSGLYTAATFLQSEGLLILAATNSDVSEERGMGGIYLLELPHGTPVRIPEICFKGIATNLVISADETTLAVTLARGILHCYDFRARPRANTTT